MLNHMMKAISTSTLSIETVARPVFNVSSSSLLVKIHATALNRADLLQRKGLYPPPPGASNILGLELAGVVEEVGDGAKLEWKKGDRLCALLSGGGYAQYAVIPSSSAIRLPDSIDFVSAAALPEAYLTSFQTLFWLSDLRRLEKLHSTGKEPLNVLVHAGASGIGTSLIQILKRYKENNTKVFATCSSDDKVEFCKKLGADISINAKTDDFSAVVHRETNQRGVDIVVDFVGASYWEKNIASLANDGCMVILSFLGGAELEKTNLSAILRKRLTIRGSTLRARPDDYKAELIRDFLQECWPHFILKDGEVDEKGRVPLRPLIDSVYPWNQAEEAHSRMASNINRGKIVLEVKHDE